MQSGDQCSVTKFVFSHSSNRSFSAKMLSIWPSKKVFFSLKKCCGKLVCYNSAKRTFWRQNHKHFLEIVFLSVSALEVVVVGGGVDVSFVAQKLQSVVHVVATHSTSNLKKAKKILFRGAAWHSFQRIGLPLRRYSVRTLPPSIFFQQNNSVERPQTTNTE